MKKVQKKLIFLIILISGLMFILVNNIKVVATEQNNQYFQGSTQCAISDNYLEYYKLPEETRENGIEPKMYSVSTEQPTTENSLKTMRMLGAASDSTFSLQDVIRNNIQIRNQERTQMCWAFAALSSVETNLALADKYNSRAEVIYDFSERHMEYSSVRTHLNGTNKYGLNRALNSGGNAAFSPATTYLSSDLGPINESDMRFSNDMNPIEYSELVAHSPVARVYDMVEFPDPDIASIAELKQQLKEFIGVYGSVSVGIYGAQPGKSVAIDTEGNSHSCYNNSEGALYCDKASTAKIDKETNLAIWSPNHAVSIIGWDDNFAVDKFNENNRPSSPGAWIARNSWGTDVSYTYLEMKTICFMMKKDEKGWSNINDVSEAELTAFATEYDYQREGDNFVLHVGKNGLYYISYEDCNVYNHMRGVEKAEMGKDYDHLYTYGELGFNGFFYGTTNTELWQATIFTKDTDSTEYLTSVGVYTYGVGDYKVFVNPNGTEKSRSDLQEVPLAAGNKEVFGNGYHTLEFANPVEIKSKDFVVAIQITNGSGTKIAPYEGNLETDLNIPWKGAVQLERGKSFISEGPGPIDNNNWLDVSEQTAEMVDRDDPSVRIDLKGADLTIRAFTTNTISDESLDRIEVFHDPDKTTYLVGDAFDPTGMIIRAYRKNGTYYDLEDGSYTITNGSKLVKGQTFVTIKYQDKEVNFNITVTEKVITRIEMGTEPKKDYTAGEDFEKGSMTIKVYYEGSDEPEEISADKVEIVDGEAIKNNQSSVTIKYGENTFEYGITVQKNLVTEIEITKEPRLTYVVGESFQSDGMEVTVTYENGIERTVESYTVEGGENLTKSVRKVIVRFDNMTKELGITVNDDTPARIEVTKTPKTTYRQFKDDLDVAGGIITVYYTNEVTKPTQIAMTSSSVHVTGFDNTKIGKNKITVEYLGLFTSFEVDIVGENNEPKNSDFSSANARNKLMKIFYYTDKNVQDYSMITIAISGIKAATGNDKMEYAYYLSSKQNETTIADSKWIKLANYKIEDGKMELTIDTRVLSNYDEITKAQKLYLYIRETATKGSINKSVVSKAMDVTTAEEKHEYLDGQERTQGGSGGSGGSGDPTQAPGGYPYTGKLLLTFAAIAIITAGTIGFIRYRNIDK